MRICFFLFFCKVIILGLSESESTEFFSWEWEEEGRVSIYRNKKIAFYQFEWGNVVFDKEKKGASV